MDNDLQMFGFEGTVVRTIVIDDVPWFVGKDVAEILGYTNPSKAIGDHCKGVTKRYPLATVGGIQELRVIPESDVYRLIIGSHLESAQRFEKWLMEEVLPSIRKNGGYLSPEVDWTDPDKIMKLVEAWKADRAARLEAEARVNRLVHDRRTYTSTEIAKELGFRSAQELHQKLHDKGIIYKDDKGVWLTYAEYSTSGFQSIKQSEINGRTVYHANWTGTGREWLMGLFVTEEI